MGLEFLIISDVIETISKPITKQRLGDLIKVAFIVVIRTVIDQSIHVSELPH